MDNQKKSNLHIRGELKPHRQTVLFIPGAMTSPAVFRHCVGELSCQTAIVDWSRSPGPWDVVYIGRRVLTLIEEYNLDDTILCGYSFGGVIALSAAIYDDKKKIRGLVLSNTGANGTNHGDMQLPMRIEAEWPSRDLVESFIRRCFAKPISEDLFEELVTYACSLDKQTAYDGAFSVRTRNIAMFLPRITCPTLLLHGKLDKARTQEHVDELYRGIRHMEVHYLDAGHTPMVEDRERYIYYLREFVERIMGKAEERDK